MPHLAGLAERFEDRQVSVVAVFQGMRTRSVKEMIEESGTADLAYSDESGAASDDYEIRGVPTTVIIDGSGRLMFRHVGFEEGMEEVFAREIETLLAWREEG